MNKVRHLNACFVIVPRLLCNPPKIRDNPSLSTAAHVLSLITCSTNEVGEENRIYSVICAMRRHSILANGGIVVERSVSSCL